MLTYKSLFSLVSDQIQKRIRFNTASPYSTDGQMSRSDSEPFMMQGSGRRDLTANELIEAMQALLDEALPNNIIEGLEVTATDPVSNAIVISAGKGTAGGVMYELTEDVTLAVPFDSETEVFYVTLHRDVIRFDKKEDTKKLKLAKIIVPNPGVTNKVKDRRADEYAWDAYIVNFHKYDLYGIYDTFEEDTVDLLRDNIGAILADNLIGNLRLSENMRITNTAGTLLLDSQSVQILDADSHVMAKFNRNGTFFYNTNGIEVAKFTVDEARIGNIKVTTNSIQSANFQSTVKGFRILDSGYAEFEDVRVRGVIHTTVFEYNTISAVGGELIIANSSQLVYDMTSLDSAQVRTEAALFSVGEVLVIKDGIREEYMLVTNIAAAPTYDVTRDLKGSYPSNEKPTWEKGTAVVSTGKAGTGYIKLDATSYDSPFMDVITRNSSVWDDRDVKVRLGNLAGISDPYFGTLSGYGLYSDNAYLKGTLWADIVKTAEIGSRIYMDTNIFVAYDDSENAIFQIILDNPPSGMAVGDITIGNYTGGMGIYWDASAASMTLRGLLNADDIVVGNLAVSFLESGTTYGCEILLDSASYIKSTNFPAIGYGWKLGGDGSIQMILPDNSGVIDGYIQSQNFINNTSGWKLRGDGSIQFNLTTGSYLELGETSYINLENSSYIKSNNWISHVTGWKLLADGTIDIRLAQLTDVTITSPKHREVLFYNQGTNEWKNRWPNAVYADDTAPSSSSSSSSRSSSSSSSSSSSRSSSSSSLSSSSSSLSSSSRSSSSSSMSSSSSSLSRSSSSSSCRSSSSSSSCRSSSSSSSSCRSSSSSCRSSSSSSRSSSSSSNSSSSSSSSSRSSSSSSRSSSSSSDSSSSWSSGSAILANQIDSWTELTAMAASGTGYWILTRSLLSSDIDYINKGDKWENFASTFNGILDGKGYVIHNLVYNGTTGGLFTVTDSAVISNLGLEDVSIIGSSWCGGIVADATGGGNDTIIYNCYVTGSVTGGAEGVGGLCGWHIGDIRECWSSATVTSSANAVGGLVGYAAYNYGVLGNHFINCYATGNVTGYDMVGGMIGYYDDYSNDTDIIINCYATGDVYANMASGSPKASGLIGEFYDDGYVVNSYATGKVTTAAISKICLSGMGYCYTVPINCGWYKDPATEATYCDAYNSSADVYEDIENWFYDKTSDIYDTPSSGTTEDWVWDFSTPVWYDRIADFPKLEAL